MSLCGDFGGISTSTGRPCQRAAGWGVAPATDVGPCRTHLEATVGYSGGAETCGDYGGIAASTGRPCLRSAGWGFPGQTTGPCKTHYRVPVDIPVAPPVLDEDLPELPPTEVEDEDTLRWYIVESMDRVFPGVTRYVNANQEMLIRLNFRTGRGGHDSIVASLPGGTINKTGPFEWTVSAPSTMMGNLAIHRKRFKLNGDLEDTVGNVEFQVPVGPAPTFAITAGLLNPATEQTDAFKTYLSDKPARATHEGSGELRLDYGMSITDKWGFRVQGDLEIFTDYPGHYYDGKDLDAYLQKNPDLDPTTAKDLKRKGFQHIEIIRGGDVTFDGVTIRGPRPSNSVRYDAEQREFQHAVAVYGTQGFSLLDCRAQDVWGDLLLLASMPNKSSGFYQTQYGQGLFNLRPAAKIVIANLVGINPGRQAISPTSVEGMEMYGGRLDRTQRTVWDQEPPGKEWWTKNVLIRDVTVGSAGNYVVSTGGNGEYMRDCEYRGIIMEGKGFAFKFAGNKERGGLKVKDCYSTFVSKSPFMVDLGRWDGTAEFTGNTGWHDAPTMGSGADKRNRPAIDATNCPATIIASGNNWRSKTGAVYPMELRQTIYPGNDKTEPPCRIIEKLTSGSPVTVLDTGACDS